MYPFTKTMGLPMVFVPYGNPDETNHAPNENMSLEAFWRGVRTSAAVFTELASLGTELRESHREKGEQNG